MSHRTEQTMSGHETARIRRAETDASSGALKRTATDAAADVHPSGDASMVPQVYDPHLPKAEGLFDPLHGRDSCGVGFIADLHNRKTHDIVEQGLQILLNLDHRGAVGADPKLGDGCGILVQIPHDFFVEECARAGIRLPAPQKY